MGELIKKLRIEKGLSQKELATALGLTTSAIGNYELNFREPSLDTLKKLCKLFDVTADFLLGLTDYY